MASAQVLPNSRKLGHLEAGKKKLEEFRKRKAEGRAKKAASTGQFIPSDVDHHDNVSQNYEHVRDGAKSTADTNSSGLNIAGESKEVNSSQSTEIPTSNRTHGSSPLLVDSNHATYGESKQNDGNEVHKSYEGSVLPELVNGFYDQWKGNNELSHKKETNVELPNGSATEQFDAFSSVKIKSPDIDKSNSSFHSSYNPSPGEDRNSSKALTSHSETSSDNSLGTPESLDAYSWRSRMGNPSTSANTSTLRKESSPVVGHTGGMLYPNGVTDFSSGGAKIVDSIDHNLHVDSARWHDSEPSYKDSSLAYKGAEYEYPIASTGFGTSSGRSRPSFLDSLGVSRVSSTGYVSYGRPEKASTPGPFYVSELQSTEVSSSGSPLPFAAFTSVGQPLQSTTLDFKGDKELSMNTFVSSNDGSLLKPAGDHNLFTSKKDEDFASLEQHIEDLTQEKFALQRALETSRTLAESLASENSSLTESYNQQGKIISQLKSDMERLQEEIKGQLSVLESMRSEYMNAQLECNAADERADRKSVV